MLVGNDRTLLRNVVAVDSPFAGEVIVVDTASRDAYLEQSQSLTSLAEDPNELQGLADEVVARYKDPLHRFGAITTTPLRYEDKDLQTSTWRNLLGLDLGYRVRVTKSMAVGDDIVHTGAVEEINHIIGPDQCVKK